MKMLLAKGFTCLVYLVVYTRVTERKWTTLEPEVWWLFITSTWNQWESNFLLIPFAPVYPLETPPTHFCTIPPSIVLGLAGENPQPDWVIPPHPQMLPDPKLKYRRSNILERIGRRPYYTYRVLTWADESDDWKGRNKNTQSSCPSFKRETV
jgi:hypothetical protein